MNEIFKSLRTWVEINLDALEYNFDAVRDELPENMKILAVVKANAYGHGAIGVAKKLIKYGVDGIITDDSALMNTLLGK